MALFDLLNAKQLCLQKRKTILNYIILANSKFRLKVSGVFIAFILIETVFCILSPAFMSLTTWANILSSAAESGIVSIGVTFLLITGEFDLSVGANLALSGIVFAFLVTHHINCFLAFGCALFVGACIGFINAVITLSLKIPSFIVTLSIMLICRGLVLLCTDGFPISVDQNNDVMNMLAGSYSQGFLTSIVWWFCLGLYLTYLINLTKMGNHMRATGLNPDIAYAQGINVTRIKLISFVVCGTLSAFAGVIQFSHLNTISPTAGEQYELYAIAAAVIGGSSLKGGYGSIIGAILGTVMMSSIDTGLVQAGVSTYWYRSFVGIILIIAVTINIHSHKLIINQRSPQ